MRLGGSNAQPGHELMFLCGAVPIMGNQLFVADQASDGIRMAPLLLSCSTMSATDALQGPWLLTLLVLPWRFAVPAFIVAFLAASFSARLAARGTARVWDATIDR